MHVTMLIETCITKFNESITIAAACLHLFCIGMQFRSFNEEKKWKNFVLQFYGYFTMFVIAAIMMIVIKDLSIHHLLVSMFWKRSKVSSFYLLIHCCTFYEVPTWHAVNFYQINGEECIKYLDVDLFDVICKKKGEALEQSSFVIPFG